MFCVSTTNSRKIPWFHLITLHALIIFIIYSSLQEHQSYPCCISSPWLSMRVIPPKSVSPRCTHSWIPSADQTTGISQVLQSHPPVDWEITGGSFLVKIVLQLNDTPKGESREKTSGWLIDDKKIKKKIKIIIVCRTKIMLKKFIAICMLVEVDFLVLVFFPTIEQYCLFLKKIKAAWIIICFSQDRGNHSDGL